MKDNSLWEAIPPWAARSNSEQVTSPSPSNIGAKKSKVRVRQERNNNNNNIKMLTFQQLTLQCCHHPLTQFHSPPLQFIQNQAAIHHLSHQLNAHCHHPWKVLCPMLQKTDISVTSHRIFSDLNISATQWEVIEFSPLSEGSLFWNRFQFGSVFQDSKSRVHGTRAWFNEQR